MSPVRDRAAEYREIGYRLWRMSLDRGNDLGFEDRSRIATIADELEDLADAIEEEIAAD